MPRKLYYIDAEGKTKKVTLAKTMIAASLSQEQHDYLNREMARLQVNRNEVIRRCVDRAMNHENIEDILLLKDDISNLNPANIPMRFYNDQLDWLLGLVEKKKIATRTEAVRRCLTFCMEKDWDLPSKS